jgi:hypothetical protein
MSALSPKINLLPKVLSVHIMNSLVGFEVDPATLGQFIGKFQKINKTNKLEVEHTHTVFFH